MRGLAVDSRLRVRENLVTNGSFEYGIVGVGAGTAVPAQSVDWSAVGTHSVKTLPRSDGQQDSYTSIGGGVGGIRLGMQAGHTYTLSGTIYTPIALVGPFTSLTRTLTAFWHTLSLGSYQNAPSPAAPAVGEGRVSVTFTLPPDTNEAFIRLENGCSNVATNAVYFDAIMLTEGPDLVDYFDGDSLSARWTGTPGESTSLCLVGPDGRPIGA